MTIISFSFLVFLFLSVIVYYIFPKKYRWIILLISSLIFFLSSCSLNLIYYLFSGIVMTYAGAILINKFEENKKYKKLFFILSLVAIIMPLFAFKYLNILPLTVNAFGRMFNLDFGFTTINLLAPLGISYYTLSLISYVVDVYWGTCKPEKNILKHALFACYYPSIISGPIIRYPYMKEQFFSIRKINWSNIYVGFYRIVFGLMKKLVIADGLAQIVSQIFSDYNTYSGVYIIFGLICYAIQIYADFSGCMDIVIGASRMYGVILPENFDSPFFSKNLSEFWRRWHISLGTWGKDYLMYPLLKSSLFQKLGSKCRKKFGKKIGKKIPTILSIFILWLLIGIWHGASFRYIFAAGILPWIYLTVGQIFENVPNKLTKVLHINTNTFSFRLFQSLRTFAFMCFIWLFVCAPTLSSSTSVIKAILNPSDLYLYSSLPQLAQPVFTLLIILLIVVDYLNYRKINVFEKFKEQNIIFRWIVLFILIVVILLYGHYGPLYNSVDFIYGGF